MRSGDGFQVSNQAAATFGPFRLLGGRYQLSAKATWGGGNVILQQIMPDGTTAVTLFGQPSSATPNTWVGLLSADGVLTFLDLPPGSYQLVYATGTAGYFNLTMVPQE